MITPEEFHICPLIQRKLARQRGVNPAKGTVTLDIDVAALEQEFSLGARVSEATDRPVLTQAIIETLSHTPQLLHDTLNQLVCSGCEHNVPYHVEAFRTGTANCVPVATGLTGLVAHLSFPESPVTDTQ